MSDHGGCILFETSRLCARRITSEDLDCMHAVYGDAETMKFVGDGEPITRDQCVEWIAVTQANYSNRGYGMSAVSLKESRDVIGFCGIVHPRGQAGPEIKYAFRRSHWGCGYATEIVSAMLDYGASTLGLRRIVATIHAANTASERVLTKAGMTHGDTIRHDDGSYTKVFQTCDQKSLW